MSFRWLASTVGARFRPGVRRRMAPQAQRDLSAEIEVDALPVLRLWARTLVPTPDQNRQPEMVVIARVDPGQQAMIAEWLHAIDADEAEPAVRTAWLLFPAIPEAVLMTAFAAGSTSSRFNLRISADRWRRQLEALAETGLLGLSAEPLQVGPARELLSPCRFVQVPAGPLRAFLRELPAPPVV